MHTRYFSNKSRHRSYRKELVRTLNLTWKTQIKTASREHRRIRCQNHFHSASFRIAEASEVQLSNCNKSVRSLENNTKHRSHIETSPLPRTLRFYPYSTINTDNTRRHNLIGWLLIGEEKNSFRKYLFTAEKVNNDRQLLLQKKNGVKHRKMTT